MRAKKFLLFALCLFILGTFISACGGDGKTIPSDNSTFYYLLAQQNSNNNQNNNEPQENPTLPTLEVNPTELNLGIEEEATVTITLEGEDVTEQVTYTSDKELIATAEKGVVKAGIQAGIENNPLVATITVSLEGANSTSFTVNVTDDSDNEVALNDDVLDQLNELGIIAKGSADKKELTEANIPAIFKYTDGKKYKITSITEKIFKECTLLKTATIPDSVTTIETGAFDTCSSLENVTIGNSVENIEDGAFHNCSSLKEIIIPDSVTSIGEGAFSGCSSLETVNIGKNVKTIGIGAFKNCNSLETVNIGENVKTIDSGAFSGCTNSNLTIKIPDDVTTIGTNAFENVEKITYTSKMKADKTDYPWGAKNVVIIIEVVE